MRRIGWRAIPILIFLLLSVFLWRGLSLDPHYLPSAVLDKALPEFNLPQLEHPEQYAGASLLKGRVSLLNVWASWCQACVEEQVFLLQLAREGVPIYGLNYKDNAADARRWLNEWGNPYQQVMQDTEGRVAIDLGVYGAPETFVVDKKGIVRYRHVGVLKQKEWLDTLLPLIRQLERES